MTISHAGNKTPRAKGIVPDICGSSARLILAIDIGEHELYGFLLFAGAVAVFIAFSFLALNYLPGPDWFWFLVGFVGLFWMCFLIHQKFG